MVTKIGKNSLSDQAQELRRIVDLHRRELRQESGMLRTVAVLSGKGGVGKTSVSVNLASAMRLEGQRVAILDADLGMANVDLLCGVVPKYTLYNLICGDRSMEEVLVNTDKGLIVLPGGTGVKELADIDESQLNSFIASLSALEDRADYLIIDTGAGIHKGVIAFASAADMALVVTTPEPTSIRDAYGVLKSLNTPYLGCSDVRLIVNMVASEEEGMEVANRIQMAAKQFLGMSLSYLGYILRDEKVEKSVRMRKPFVDEFPDSYASKCVKALSARLLGKVGMQPPTAVASRGIKSFFLRFVRGAS